MKIFYVLKTNDYNNFFGTKVVTTNGFALNHDKNLQIYFFCGKRQAKCDFLKDVESTVTRFMLWTPTVVLQRGCGVYRQCHMKMYLRVYADSKGPDQPAHLCSLIRASIVY